MRDREAGHIFQDIQAITTETQNAVYSSVAAIGQILSDSPSLCTPTFVANIQKQLQHNVYLRQVLVENNDGVQYCDGYGQTARFSVLSPNLSVPGNADTISVIQFDDAVYPGLRITRFVGNQRKISAFVHLTPKLTGSLPYELEGVEFLRVRLTDGTDVLTIGDADLLTADDVTSNYIYAQSVADALPLVVEVLVPFDLVRAEYADLSIAITIVASLMSASFLLLAVHYVRQARLPGFQFERALKNGELKPYYQPVMNMTDGSLVGCEVLVRWEKPDGKTIPPNLFIDYAEATGLAIPMTIKLMEQMREDLEELCAQTPNLKIGINLFEGHFQDTSIVEDVQAIFDNSAIKYRQLVFEITERRPLENQLATKSVIGSLQALGCRIAMDDAGTGHSNLEYLQTLGVDILKIDRVFINMITAEAEAVPVLDALIGMAREMNLSVVAEGVESEEQAVYLREHGVVEAQGFLFAPALKSNSFIELAIALAERTRDPGGGNSSLPPGLSAKAKDKSQDEAAA